MAKSVLSALTLGEGVNLAFGTATGTQIGTATTQKLGFYGATPIVKASPGGTFANLLTALANLGLIVGPTAAIANADIAAGAAIAKSKLAALAIADADVAAGAAIAYSKLNLATSIVNADVAAAAAIANTKLDSSLARGTMYYGQTTGGTATSQSGISAYVDLLTTSTITIPAGRRIRITGTARLEQTVLDGYLILAIRDTANTTYSFALTYGLGDITIMTQAIYVPGAISKQYKLSAEKLIGTGTWGWTQDATNPAFIHVEDVGV